MHHEPTPAPPRQPWQAPRLVEQPAVNTAQGGFGPDSDASGGFTSPTS